MDFERFLTPQVVSALSVGISALVGGVLALLHEFRRAPEDDAEATVEELGAVERRLSAQLREETDHIDRSVWIVERRLSERLATIEAQLAQDRR